MSSTNLSEGKNWKTSEAHFDQLSTADSNFGELQPKIAGVFDALFNAIPQSFLLRIQDFTAYLYIWKTSKSIFLQQENICEKLL